MSLPARSLVRGFRTVAGYPNHRTLLHSAQARCGKGDKDSGGRDGYSPPMVELPAAEPGRRSLAVRDIDLPLLCQEDEERAAEHLFLILAARQGDRCADAALRAAVLRHYADLKAGFRRTGPAEDEAVVPSTSRSLHPESLVSHKGALLLKLSRLGYPVPDFVILTSEARRAPARRLETLVHGALSALEDLSCQRLGAGADPLVFALRCAMPCYTHGVLPTFLNVGATEGNLPALARRFGERAAARMLLNNLKNLRAALDPGGAATAAPGSGSGPGPEEVSRLAQRLADEVRARDPGLLEDPARQACLLVREAFRQCAGNRDLLRTLCRGAEHAPAFILQKMVCTVRGGESYAGVLYSRDTRTGTGAQLETAKDVFGEEIMTGTAAPRRACFEDRESVREEFPAVHHFHPMAARLERELQSPVTIEFACEAARRYQLFALLQVDASSLTGRAAFVSVTRMHKAGVISRKRVCELIQPFHRRQVESDSIDPDCLESLEPFCGGVSVLPRSAVSARVYFSAEDALAAKARGGQVCLCKSAFAPGDAAVLREMDAALSLAPAAIHVLTVCQGFGAPALLDLERDGVRLERGALVNASGSRIEEGDWVTVSSRRQGLFKGRARFRPARFLRYLRGEPVELSADERRSFEELAQAYRYYGRLEREPGPGRACAFKDVVRRVNLDLRGDPEEARRLVRGWFDAHEAAYLDGVLGSGLGDHLDQHTAFDLLTPDRKARFFKAALERCLGARTFGYAAGAFMLGRFVSQPQPVALWRALAPDEQGFLVNEWVLFEKYMQVLYDVGEREALRARRRMLEQGLGELRLTPWSVKALVPLKLGGVDLKETSRRLPEWRDPQAAEVLELLGRPYKAFYDFSAPWSLEELTTLCRLEGVPVPGPDETGAPTGRKAPAPPLAAGGQAPAATQARAAGR